MLEQEEKRSLHRMLLVSFLKVTGLTFDFNCRNKHAFMAKKSMSFRSQSPADCVLCTVHLNNNNKKRSLLHLKCFVL